MRHRILDALVGLGLLFTLTAPAVASKASCPRDAWAQPLSQARTAMLRNDDQGLRAFFTWVSGRQDLPDLSARTRDLAQDPRLQRGQGEPGDLVELGADALGDVGLACAACHARVSAKVHYAQGEMPAVSEATKAHMTRHLWAMDRLWEGLIGPSNERWTLGEQALHDHTLDAETLHGRDAGESPSDYMDWWIHQKGPELASTADQAGRAKLYGQVLTACAACHAGTAGAPTVPQGPPENQAP